MSSLPEEAHCDSVHAIAGCQHSKSCTECSEFLERIYVISETEADPQLGREDELNLLDSYYDLLWTYYELLDSY